MTSTWDDQATAIGMRDVIGAIADARIQALRPEVSYAVVQSINREARSATVIYMGETDPVSVAMGSIEPATVGQTVRLGGTLGHRYIEDVLGNALMSGNDTRYAQVGHTHAGGGAVELDLNDLGDVDTATNPPDGDSVLGWNDVGGFWEPVSIDLGTAYLPLAGGTVTGPVNFDAAITMDTTLQVGGAVQGQSFAGVGTALTNLNASALASGTVPVARFPTTIGSNTTGTAAAWTTARLLSIEGDMVGTALLKGDQDISLSVALQPNSIALGADTTGDYVQHVIGTANQIISNTVVAGEGTIHTLSLPQNIHAAATPTFSRLTLSQATGTAPLSVTSQTVVTNFNADLLDGQQGSFYQNAGNLNAGTLPSARLTGVYNGITGLGTLSTLTVTGVAAFTATPTVSGATVWHAGNDGAGSGLDAGLLGGVLPDGYASTEIVESLMGDLLAVGLYDAASYNGDLFSLHFDRPTQQQMTGFTLAAGDAPLDVRFDIDMPEIPQADVATGENRRRLIRNGVFLDVYRGLDDDHLIRSAGYAMSAADASLVAPGTGFTIRARVRKTDLDAVGIRQIARRGSTASDEAWTLYMDSGKLVFRCSANGSTMTTVDVLTFAELDAIAGTADNTDFYVAVSVVLTGTQVQCRGWGSANGVTWTTAAATKSAAFTSTSLFATTAPLYIGGFNVGEFWDGRIYWVDLLPENDPNGSSVVLWRFDPSEHPYAGGVSFMDARNRTWTLSAASAIIHAYYVVQFLAQTNAAQRDVSTAAFSYSANVGRRRHIRGSWNPTTDTLSAGHRDPSVGLESNTAPWTEVTAAFAGESLAASGALVIGQGTNAALNWSFGGRMFRSWISRSGITVLDVSNLNLTVIGQTLVIPTTGPTMTLSAATMAQSTMPKPVWVEGPTVYRHNMYWIVSSTAEIDFIDSDLSGRYEIDIDDAVIVANGDWIIAVDPLFGAPGHEEGANLTLGEMLFQYIPFSTETYVKAKLQEHLSDPLDPHSAAGYLKAVIANALYAPLVHTHAAEISGYIGLHEAADDPHPQYLTISEANGLYLKPGDIQPYEPQGAVLQHEQKTDPHPQYVTHAEGNQAFSPQEHIHVEYAHSGHTHPDSKEVLPTDGAMSSRIFVGDDEPVDPQVGDLWIQTFDIALQAPAAPTGLSISSAQPTSLSLQWNAFDPSVAQTAVEVERSLNGLTGWTNIFSDNASPFANTAVDTGRNERTSYFYRVRGVNAVGVGAWGSISGTTTNGPPALPSSLSISGVTPTDLTLNWAAVSSPGHDPLHPTQPYEVFKNGVSQGFTTATSFHFGSLAERTSYTLGVRSKDDLGVTSAIASLSASTSNAAPPAPTGLYAIGVNHHQFHMGWNAVGGISDFSRYQVFVNGGYWADTTATNYLFSDNGLGPSGNYNFQVRTVDTSEAVSGLSTLNYTLSPNPDTTPPGPINFRSWQPRNNYGEMYFEFDAPGDVAYGEIYYNVNGAGWVVTYAGGLGGYHMHYNGTHGANQTIYAAVNYRDAAGNWYYSPHYAYTLVPSPSLFGPHSSNSWRNSNGGEWNAGGGYRVIYGYFSNPQLNSVGFWFFGTDFQNWWQHGRTITGANVFVNREGCGINQQDWVHFGVHDMLSSPGTTSFWGFPNYAGHEFAGTVQYGEAKWMPFPVDWIYQMCGGAWRGIIAWAQSGKPYVCLHPAGAGYSGVVEVHHLG